MYALRYFLAMLLCLLSLLMPAKSQAAFPVSTRCTKPAEGVIHLPVLPDFGQRMYHYRAAHHFRGRRGDFWGGFAFTCSILGSVSIGAALVTWAAGVFSAPLIGAGMVLSVAGVVFGIIYDSNAGKNAVLLGLINVLASFLIFAIYDASIGDYTGIANFLSLFVPH